MSSIYKYYTYWSTILTLIYVYFHCKSKVVSSYNVNHSSYM